jgi:hypothetical protein
MHAPVSEECFSHSTHVRQAESISKNWGCHLGCEGGAETVERRGVLTALPGQDLRRGPASAYRFAQVGYLGRSYARQVGEFVALVSAAWADASPSLPGVIREDPAGFPGLPPAGP